MMSAPHDVVFLLDVDNTLLDNDRFLADLKTRLTESFDDAMCARYFSILESLRLQIGYVDYLGALQCFRLEDINDPRMLSMSAFLLDYPFETLRYPSALAVIAHLQRWGPTVIVSDGDAVFQPRKIARAGFWDAVEGRVRIYVHKELMLDAIEKDFPARRYVMVDDKLRLLSIMKGVWGDRLTTVFPRQGHYALDAEALARYDPPDITIERIGDLLAEDFSALHVSTAPVAARSR